MMSFCNFEGNQESFQRCILQGYEQSFTYSQMSITVAILTSAFSLITAIYIYQSNKRMLIINQKITVSNLISKELIKIRKSSRKFWMSEEPKIPAKLFEFESELESSCRYLINCMSITSRNRRDIQLLKNFEVILIKLEGLMTGLGQQIIQEDCPYDIESELIKKIDEYYLSTEKKLMEWVSNV